MSKVRLREGYGPRDVPVLDRQVEDGEVVEVPDFQADGVSPLVWPDATWEPVGDVVVDPEPDPAAAPEAAPEPETVPATDEAAA